MVSQRLPMRVRNGMALQNGAGGSGQRDVVGASGSNELKKPASFFNPHGSNALSAAAVLVVGAWAYWPALVYLVATWNREPDYSHGFLVAPLAAYLLWHRRSSFPGICFHPSWAGLLLLCASAIINIAGGLWFMEPLRAWSLPLWIGGVCWFFYGWRVLRWSLPAVAFLGFMIPLPYRVETFLTMPLQRTATQVSCWLLQSLGQPAIAEGNVIAINDARLAVAEACSGLRIFVSVIALAYVFAALSKKPWWLKASLFAVILPIALIANAVRIAATGLLQVHVSGEAAHRFTHDVAGWAMIMFAASLFGGVLWYMGRVVFEVQIVSTGELLSYDRHAPDQAKRGYEAV